MNRPNDTPNAARPGRPWRCSLLATLVLAALVPSAGLPAAETPDAAVVTAHMSLADYARLQQGREAYGLYLAEGKVGWMTIDTRLTKYEGDDVLELTTECQLSARFLGQQSTMEMTGVVRYGLSGNGELVSIEEREREDGQETVRTAQRDGNQLVIEAGPGEVRRVPLPLDTLAASRDLDAWLNRPPARGETFTTYTATLSEAEIDQAETLEFVEQVEMVWGGVPLRVAKTVTTMDGATGEMWVASDGNVLKGTLGSILEFRAEEEEVAKQLKGDPVDMLAASAIQVDEPLGETEDIESLTLNLSGLGDFRLPSSERQIVERGKGGRARVKLQREPAQATPAPLTPEEKRRYLRATPSVQCDQQDIKQLAAEIVGDEQDPLARAERIVEWIAGHLAPSYGANASTAVAVLEKRKGDCTEHALLFTALARAANVPARQVGGVVYVEEPKPLFGWHAWAEIHDGQGWVTVDPMWHQVRVDPTHVQFSVDDERDSAWINVLGALRIEIEDVRRAKK